MIQARNVNLSALISVTSATVSIGTTEKVFNTLTIPVTGRYFLILSQDINVLNQSTIGNTYIALKRNGSIIANSQRYFNFNQTYFIGGVDSTTIINASAGDTITAVGKTSSNSIEATGARGSIIAIQVG